MIGKIVISRDIEYNKERACDWKVDEEKEYKFLLVLNEKRTNIQINKNL